MKKLFGETKISWKFLIIFSILCGIVVGVLNRIPVLKNTSFQDIAVVFDMWIVLAIFIIVNCENWKEAVGKCFCFFLISQPLVYLSESIIDALFYNANFIEKLTLYFNNYYIHAGWLTWTILTIPGAFIAFQVKKNNILSAIVLSVATTFLAFFGTKGLINIVLDLSLNHLLNSVLCLFFAYYLIFILLSNKRERVISIILTSLGILVGVIYSIYARNIPIIGNTIIDLNDGEKAIECSVEDEDIATAQIEDGAIYIYSSKKVGTTEMSVKSENEKEYVYIIESSSKGIFAELK